MKTDGMAVSVAVAIPLVLVVMLIILAVNPDQPRRVLGDEELAAIARKTATDSSKIRLGLTRLGKHNGTTVMERNWIFHTATIAHVIYYDRKPGRACDRVGGLTMFKEILGFSSSYEQFCIPVPVAIAECQERRRQCYVGPRGTSCIVPGDACSVAAIREDERKFSIDPIYKASLR